MIRPTTILAIVILLGSAFGLFQVKYRVQDLNKDVAEMGRQIEEEKNAIHVLNAEWAYLNQPDRLRTLAEKYLQLSAVTVSQLKEPAMPAAEVAVAEAAPKSPQPVVSSPVKVAAVERKKVPLQEKLVKTAKLERMPSKPRQVARKERKEVYARNNMQPLYPTMDPILSSLTIER